MLGLLVLCIVVCVVAAFALWLLRFITFDATMMQVIRGLIIFFAVVFIIITLYNGRAAFGLH